MILKDGLDLSIEEGAIKENDSLSILVVEDDPAIQSLVSLGLRYEHYHVIAANNGLMGSQLFEEQNRT